MLKTVADFFAGIGLVTAGLKKSGWNTIYALDYDKIKKLQYTTNFGKDHYFAKDIFEELGVNVPNVTLAHASFPCTDLSIAGSRQGIYHGETSAFWEFVRVIKEMKAKYGESSPPFILLENVEGLLNSNSGRDLYALLKVLNELGYYVDLLCIDAARFVPQSRKRIFIVGIHKSLFSKLIQNSLVQEHNLLNSDARPSKIIRYIRDNSDINWYFHPLPNLPTRTISFKDIIDQGARWWPKERAVYLYNQLHDRQKKVVDELIHLNQYQYFPAFRRMRIRNGRSQPTIELRMDGVAGCLRTPKGGSARQMMVRVGKGQLDVRLINAKEAALLMGAEDFVIHPSLSLNQALFGFGDAVVVPVLQWLGDKYFNTLLERVSKVQELEHLNVLNEFSVSSF